MKRFYIEGWEVDIDLDKTAEYYESLDQQDLLTCCLYCKNYYYGISKVSNQLVDFLKGFNIIPEITAYLSEYYEIDDNKHLYGATYLLVGEIVVIPEGVKIITEKGYTQMNPKHLPDGSQFHFTKEIDIGPSQVKLCPEPIIQLDITCKIPWVLDEKP